MSSHILQGTTFVTNGSGNATITLEGQSGAVTAVIVVAGTITSNNVTTINMTVNNNTTTGSLTVLGDGQFGGSITTNSLIVSTNISTDSLSVSSTASIDTLNAGDVTINGTLGVTGTSTLGSVIANTLTTNSFTNIESLSVTNNATINGTLLVAGTTTLQGVSASNLTTSGDLTVNGNIWVKNGISVFGQNNASAFVDCVDLAKTDLSVPMVVPNPGLIGTPFGQTNVLTDMISGARNTYVSGATMATFNVTPGRGYIVTLDTIVKTTGGLFGSRKDVYQITNDGINTTVSAPVNLASFGIAIVITTALSGNNVIFSVDQSGWVTMNFASVRAGN